MYGNCLNTSAFAPTPLIHAQHCYCAYVLLRCAYLHGPVTRVFHPSPLLDGPACSSHAFSNPAFSASPTEVAYYFWATLYSLLVRLNTRYSFNWRSSSQKKQI